MSVIIEFFKFHENQKRKETQMSVPIEGKEGRTQLFHAHFGNSWWAVASP